MAKSELQTPWEMNILDQEDSLEEKPSLAKEAHDFAKFISDSPVNLVIINSVIPTVNYGTFYSVTVGTIESFEKTPQGAEITANAFSVDNRILDLIEDSLDGMTEEEQEETTILRKNLFLIRSAVTDPFNWDDPFNTRSDN